MDQLRLRRLDWLLGGTIVLLAALVRLHDLTAGGIWLDEGYSLLQSERSVADILSLRRYDANPPLYVLLLHAWRAVFGPGELAAKSLSLVAGVAGVAAVWLVARLRFGAWASVVAGLLVALSRFHVHYSQEIRGYALLFAAVATADLFFVRWEATGRRRDLAGWIGAGLVAVSTHYFAWWVLGSHALLASRRRLALIAAAGVMLVSLPNVLAFVEHLTTFKTQSWLAAPDFDALVQLLWVLGGCGPIAWLVWGLAILGLAAHLWPRLPALMSRDAALPGWRTATVPGLQLTLPFVVWVVSVLAMPMLAERYLLLSLLPLACLAGAGVAALRISGVRPLLLAALVLLSLPPLDEHYAQEERSGVTQEAAELLRTEYRAGDVVLYTSKWNFVPFVALHPPGMAEFLLPAIAGNEYSTILLYYTSRPVRRDPPRPGEYSRLWLVRRPEEVAQPLAGTGWFEDLGPRLAWQHPSGLLLRFDLGE